MIFSESLGSFYLLWCLVALNLSVIPVDCCPVNTTLFNSKCYELIDDHSLRISYTDVLSFCSRRHDGIPVVIDGPEIFNFILSLVQSSPISLFIGLTDLANEGAFVWSDGRPLDWRAWSPTNNQPNGGTNEDCVMLKKYDSWRWHDDSCTVTRGFICQYTVIDGGWSDWQYVGPCSTTCGRGRQSRYRICGNPQPMNGGSYCGGSASETADCIVANCSVNGGWSDWGDWSACSVTCGDGVLTRDRNCTNPRPEIGGLNCTGKFTQLMYCSTQNCGVNGGWSEWGDWSTCSVSCGDGVRLRERNCTNPSPEFGGLKCFGKYTEMMNCFTQNCRVNGGWNDWGDWGACSVSCGGGSHMRGRNCTNPRPEFGGLNCTGNSTEMRNCSTQNCTVDGAWSDWGVWSACSVSCGEGVRMRGRNCTNPSPEYNGLYCIGNSTEKVNCSLQDCPVNNTWSNWSAWSACSESCHQGERMRVRSCLNFTTMLNDTDKGCVGNSTETKTCAGSNCPGEGLWSHWGPWALCSASCGAGRTTRTRCCLPTRSTAPGENVTCPGSCCDQKGCSAIMKCPDFDAEISEHLISATPRKITTTWGETRPSAKGIGVVATAILVSVFGALIILDFRTLYLHFRGKPTDGSVNVENK